MVDATERSYHTATDHMRRVRRLLRCAARDDERVHVVDYLSDPQALSGFGVLSKHDTDRLYVDLGGGG